MPNTIALNVGFSSVTMTLISEGNYSSEYMSRTSTAEYRLKIRHSKEKATGNQVALDRHNTELQVRTFPTADLPNGKIETAYAVIRSDPNSDGSSSVEVATALLEFTKNAADELVAWVSTPTG